MPGFGHDPHDETWETDPAYRTVHTSADDWCPECDTEIDFSKGIDGTCGCAAYILGEKA